MKTKQQLFVIAALFAKVQSFEADFYGSEYWFDFANSEVKGRDQRTQCGGCVMAGYHWEAQTDGPSQITPFSNQEDLLEVRGSGDDWQCRTALIAEDEELGGDSIAEILDWDDYKELIGTDKYWSTGQFADRSIGLAACPYQIPACGTDPRINRFMEQGETGSITIENIYDGVACSW